MILLYERMRPGRDQTQDLGSAIGLANVVQVLGYSEKLLDIYL